MCRHKIISKTVLKIKTIHIFSYIKWNSKHTDPFLLYLGHLFYIIYKNNNYNIYLSTIECTKSVNII